MRPCGRPTIGGMAIFHLQVNTVSRSAGRSATAAAAYRAGEKIVDERTGEIHDYTRKGGVEASALFAPAGSPEWAADRAQLWNAAEDAEKRKNSTVAREFVIALPAELSAGERQGLACEFGRALVERHGVAVDVCIHAPGKDGDERNHHAHILMTTRRMTPEGLAEKTRELDNQRSGEVEHWRQEWASMANRALERAGRSERIDHRTLAEQGIERMPTEHNGPAITDMLRNGKPSKVVESREAAAAAFVHQVKTEAQALAADLAKAQAAFDQAQQEVDQLKAEQQREQMRRERAEYEKREAEDKRLKALPAEQLAREVNRMRNALTSPDAAAQRDPAYIEARQRAEDLAQQKRQADQEQAAMERQAVHLREKHGIRTWLHDSGLMRFDKLVVAEAMGREAGMQSLQLAPKAMQAEAEAKARYHEAESRQWLENAPQNDRIERYAKLAQEKAKQERDERQRMEQQQRAERQAEIKREMLARDFKSLAARRELRMAGSRDDSEDWARNTPEALRKVVEQYNRTPKERREAVLRATLDDPERRGALQAMMDARDRAIKQDRSYSR